MRNFKYFSADPYEGAYAAYRAMQPKASGQDWDDHVREFSIQAEGEIDDFAELAAICRDSIQYEGVSEDERRLIAYSTGYFEAMHSIISALIDALPTSSHMPNHFERYRSNLKRFPERYVDEV